MTNISDAYCDSATGFKVTVPIYPIEIHGSWIKTKIFLFFFRFQWEFLQEP